MGNLLKIVVSGVILLGCGISLWAQEEEEILWRNIPIVVTAAKKEQFITKAPSNVTVITAREINDCGARTLQDVLKLIPGIEINTTRKGLGRIWIRGVTSRYNNKVLFLVDGFPCRELVYGQFPVDEQFPLAHIKRIEVIRGPGSALYGANAFSGMINIITKDAEDIGGCEVGVSGGSWRTYGDHILYGKKTEKGELVFFTNHYETLGDSHERDRKGNPTDRHDPKTQEEIYLKGSINDFTFGFRHLRYNWEYLTYKDSKNRDDDWQDFSLNLGYSKSFNERLKASARLYYNYFDHLTDKREWDNSLRSSLEEFAERREKTEVFGVGVQADYELNEHNHLIAGIDYEKEKAYELIEDTYVMPDLAKTIDRWAEPAAPQNINWALFAEDIWQIKPNLNLTAGFRYDKHEEYGGAISPRVSVILNPKKDLIVKILYGRAFRAPSYRELYIRESGNENNGNKDLEPEYIQTTELELLYPLIEQAEARLNLFSEEIKDFIGTTPIVGGSRYDNLGKVKICGIESGIKARFREGKITGFANYTYYFKAEDDDGNKVTNIATHMANIGLNARLGKHLNFNATLNHIGKRTKPVDYQQKADPANRKDLLGEFDRMNLVLTSRNLPVDVSLGIYNVFDVQSFNPAYEPGSYYDIEHPGRNILLKVDHKF
ncbi:MAG: TonB-dependent receptor [Planctomycetes bacterium]|nr:TonB-dependent receptor [Planctomycetota bacterium]